MQELSAKNPALCAHDGFTLIEVILVITIIAIITAVTVPQFARSARTNRLKTSARAIVSSGRYARNIAVLRHKESVIKFDLNAGTISVTCIAKQQNNTNMLGDAELTMDSEMNAEAPPLAPAAAKPDIERTLNRIYITEVNILNKDIHTRDSCEVKYQSNGRCNPYTVKIQDDEGNGMIIRVDALGSANVTKK